MNGANEAVRWIPANSDRHPTYVPVLGLPGPTPATGLRLWG